MTTALYRISSKECIKISPKDQPFTDVDPAIWAVLTDPSTPDGTDAFDPDPIGPLRELGFSKIAEPAGNNSEEKHTLRDTH